MKKKSIKTSGLFLSRIISLALGGLYLLKIIGDSILTVIKTLLRLKYKIIRKTVYFVARKKNNSHVSVPISHRQTLFFPKRFRPISIRFRIKKPYFLTKIKNYFSSFGFYLFLVKIKYFLFGCLIVLIIAISFRLHGIVTSLPNPNYLSLRDIPTATKIYDRNGSLLYEYFAQENRTPIPLSQIPETVIKATLAIEDKDFFSHQGVSLQGITRAILHNFNSSSLQGGSTITQQLVRSALLTPDKTIQRKIVEIVLAIWTEHIYTKNQILEMYLNQVPYGGTSWGIEAASEYYFGKNAKDLDLSESALLAGLPAAPTLYSPFGENPQYAYTRQKEVLNRMTETGLITPEIAESAKREVLQFKTPTTPILAPHFVMYIRELLNAYYGSGIIAHEGLRVTTSLDLSMQNMAEDVVAQNIELLRPLHVGNAAALITNPQNGDILAMVGSPNYFDLQKEGNVNVTRALRQPGSSIKVVTYAEALSHGFTPATILYDTPVTYKVDDLPAYSPVNYDGSYHGAVTLKTALGSSYNIPAVKVLAQVGVKKMIERARLMGITTWNNEEQYGLSLTLGGGDVTMMDMAKVYGTLAAGGQRYSLHPILKITNWKGDTMNLPPVLKPIQAVSPEVTYLLTNILSDNAARTPAFGSNSTLFIPGKTVAVKTGTSDSKRDNWTIGYTPSYVASVWVGNNDNSPMDPKLTSGITGAAPIWREIMLNLLKDKPDQIFPKPENIVTISCNGHEDAYIKGTEPKGGCAIIPTQAISPTQSP